ncbi:imelysin family protein [Roseovarius sp. EL26]|uniref:imelysin family protein n=1 Tax=Roseovarius sp. EL26 TaxID=2126672 RepID=UPI000EA2B268|nr:imelysin family protein [Roseovarius sp. EL26]
MLRISALCLSLLWPVETFAQDAEWSGQINTIMEHQVLMRFDDLEDNTMKLSKAAAQSCDPEGETLRESLRMSLGAWASTSAFRFGPTEIDNHSFALGFWPDPRGKTPKALRKLILENDPIIDSAESFSRASIAARGFYAMEYMLYEPAFQEIGTGKYRCALIRRQADDIARTAQAIRDGWDDYKSHLLTPTIDTPYRTEAEVKRELFKGISTAVEFTSDTRLGRPLGTFDKPRPKRAEARRSDMSLRLVENSLASPWELSITLASEDQKLSNALIIKFSKIKHAIEELGDPALSGVSDPANRFRIESLKQQIDELHAFLTERLGPHLGVSAGFNSLDGD